MVRAIASDHRYPFRSKDTDPGRGRGEIRNWGYHRQFGSGAARARVAEGSGNDENARPRVARVKASLHRALGSPCSTERKGTEIVESSPRPHPGSKSWLETVTGGRSLTLAPPATVRDAFGVLSRDPTGSGYIFRHRTELRAVVLSHQEPAPPSDRWRAQWHR